VKLLNRILKRKKNTANIAKERLQIIISHERSQRSGKLDYLPELQKELVAVISKYVNIESDAVNVSVDSTGDYSVLELNVALPEKETAEV
jgi:cell division topological specificity factor